MPAPADDNPTERDPEETSDVGGGDPTDADATRDVRDAMDEDVADGLVSRVAHDDLPTAGLGDGDGAGAAGGTPVSDLIGTKIGPYKVLQRLGEGGMGYVLKAHDQDLNRFVALKLLHPRLAKDEKFVQQFKVEAEAIAKLNHPNVVNVYSFGEEGGMVYFAMQFIRGYELADLLREQGQLPPRRVVELMLPVVEGLAYTHSYGILHRDLKPANIMVDETTGKPMVTDFGLARMDMDIVKRRSDPDGNLTFDVPEIDKNVVLGTPAYMAPEVFAPDIYRGDEAQADVYAIGVLIYQLLTGRLPYTGNSVSEILGSALEDEAIAVPKLARAEVPARLLRCVNKAMARDPKERYASMALLQKELRGINREYEQAREIGQRKEMTREMALAMGSAGIARGRPTSGLRTMFIVAAVLAAGIGLVMIGLNLERGAGPGPAGASSATGTEGSRAEDDAWDIGTVVRVFGTIELVEFIDGNALLDIYDLSHDDGRVCVCSAPEVVWKAAAEQSDITEGSTVLLTGTVIRERDDQDVAHMKVVTGAEWFIPLREPIRTLWEDGKPRATELFDEEVLDHEGGVSGSIVRITEGELRSGDPYLDLEIYQPGLGEAEPPPPLTVSIQSGNFTTTTGAEPRIGDRISARGLIIAPGLLEVAGQGALSETSVTPAFE